jgi:hypothetical protein
MVDDDLICLCPYLSPTAHGARAGGANLQNFKRRNEEEDFFYETSRQNNLESPPRDWPTIAGHYGIEWFLPACFGPYF